MPAISGSPHDKTADGKTENITVNKLQKKGTNLMLNEKIVPANALEEAVIAMDNAAVNESYSEKFQTH